MVRARADLRCLLGTRQLSIALDGRAMSCAWCDGLTYMRERDPALEPFDVLIGTWDTEATHPLVDAVVPGTVTFEWLEGGHFLFQRSGNDHESFPRRHQRYRRPERPAKDWSWSTSTRAACAEPTASRSTTACCAFGASSLSSPSAFPPRLGRASFEGRWQLARDPGDWQDDLKVTYRHREYVRFRLLFGPGAIASPSERRPSGCATSDRQARLTGVGRGPAHGRRRLQSTRQESKVDLDS